MLNVVMIIPLLVADLAYWISPADFWLPALLATFTHYLILFPIFWTIFWVFFYIKYALINGLALIFSFHLLFNSFQFHIPSTPTDQDIHLLTFNINAFDYKESKLKSVIQSIKREKPDIICFQEFFKLQLKDKSSSIDYIKKELNLPHAAYIEVLKNKNFGEAIFSKYPIKSFGQMTPSGTDETNGIIYADIQMFGKTVRVVNVHLESYDFTSEQRKSLGSRFSLKNVWSTSKRMIKTWKDHAQQVNKMLLSLKENKKPLIICGDLNNPPYNYFYKQVRGNLSDTFTEKGRGLGQTYGKGFTSFRIDYVFVSKELNTIAHTVLDNRESDHLPVLAVLKLKSK